MKICYFDAIGGVSGDMMVASLLDATDLEPYVIGELKKLPLKPWQWQRKALTKGAFAATKIDFLVKPEQPCRHFSDICNMIAATDYTSTVKEKIISVFDLLAEAESKAHGIAKEDVHFHEVGADDTILDISAVVLLLEKLGIETVSATPLPLGKGLQKGCHGMMPLPGPALNDLLKNVRVYGIEEEGETLTPTGIALLKTYGATYEALPAMTITSVGTGCGTKNFIRPNILRCFLGSIENDRDFIYKIECTVDDMTGEDLGDLWEHIYKAGANDMYYTAVQMKKGRPGIKISILTNGEHLASVRQCLFTHSTTIGMILTPVARNVLTRTMEEIKTSLGVIHLKKTQGFGVQKEKLEFEDLKAAAERENASITTIRRSVEEERSRYDKSHSI